MSLSFPTGQQGPFVPKTGQPLKPPARLTCHCRSQRMLDTDGHCQRCGRYPQAVIDATWRRRAEAIALRGKRHRAKA